jgi:PAS domain S-box-containing protein
MGITSLSLDYLFLLHGLAWMLVVAPAWGFAREKGGTAWMFLAYWAILNAGILWLKIVLVDFGDQPAFALLRYVLQAGAMIVLIEFVRRSLRDRWEINLGPWLHLSLIALSAIVARLAAWDAAIALLIVSGGIATAAAAVIFWLGAGDQTRSSRRRICLAAVGLLLIGISRTVSFSGDLLISAATVPQAQTVHAFCTELLRLGASLLFTLPLVGEYYLKNRRNASGEKQLGANRRELSWLGALLVVLFAGWFATERAGRLENRENQALALLRMKMAAASVAGYPSDGDTAKPGETGKPIDALLEIIHRTNPDLQSLSLIEVKNGRVTLLARSTSTPGANQPAEVADPAFQARLGQSLPFIDGPRSRQGEIRVRGAYPLSQFTKSDPRALEFELSAEDWTAAILRARLPAVCISLLVALLLLIAFRGQWKLRRSFFELGASERRNRSIVEGCPHCIQKIDATGRCTMINRNGLAALGREGVEVIGLPYLQHWSGAAAERLAAAVSEAFQGRSATIEADYSGPDGRSLTFQITLSPIFDARNAITAVLSAAVDISELKRYGRELIAAKETAEQATQAKSEFLALISHEIRTPLGGIIGMLNLLRKQSQPPQQRHYTDLAQESAEVLLSLLNDLLDTAKIEAGHLNLEPIVFQPRAEFQRVVECLRPRAMEKGLELSSDFSDDFPPYLRADPTRLRQVLTNLLSNALKFTQDGAVRVTLATERRSGAEVMLCISVSDTGIGIPRSVQARLFTPFEQGSAATERLFGGSGLGLAITKHIVDQMQGTIEIESEPNQGTTFHCRVSAQLPSEEEMRRAELAEEKNSPSRHSHQLRVLCAEDEMINRIIVEGLVSGMGHTIEFANDGVHALQKLSLRDFDVVLMDNRMPRMDGVEATTVVRDLASSVRDHDIFIVATTGNASLTHREKCRTAGMNLFVAKPFREAELHAALQQAIEFQQWRGFALSCSESDQTDPAAVAPGLSEEEILRMIENSPAKSPDGSSPPLQPEMIALYLRDAPERIGQMRRALQTGNISELSLAAHSIKNISHYVAAGNLSELGGQLEAAAERGALIESAFLFSRVESEFEQVKFRLETRSSCIQYENTDR